MSNKETKKEGANIGKIKAVGILELSELYDYVKECNEKKLCTFCLNPFFVTEVMTKNKDYSAEQSKEIPINLFICQNCMKKMSFFKEDMIKIASAIKKIRISDIY
jgi:hypothetical protein